MRTKKKSGADHESAPEIAEYDNATENRLVLYALRDAMGRLNYACEIVLHTECIYTAAAFNNCWMEQWNRQGWRNSRGDQVKDAVLWSMLYLDMEDGGHIIRAEQGKHEFSGWMAWKMPLEKAYKDTFSKLPKE